MSTVSHERLITDTDKRTTEEIITSIDQNFRAFVAGRHRKPTFLERLHEVVVASSLGSIIFLGGTLVGWAWTR